MKIEAKIFTFLGIFFVPMAFIYGYLTDWKELVGFPAILLLAGLVFMISFYLNLTAKHIDPRPEDDLEGEIYQGSGEQGVFSPWSWWPLVLGAAGAICVLGLAVGWWVFFIGAGVGLVGLVGWVFEFSRGDHAH